LLQLEGGLSDQLIEALRTVARDLLRSPGIGGHVHFDDPVFRELVPDFQDLAWVSLASSVAIVLSAVAPFFLVSVPLGEWTDLPDAFTLESFTALDPWEPPAIYFLTDGSAYDHRTTHWYSDAVPQVPGSVGWVAADFNDDAGRPSPVWCASLMYETR
jgi:hypothetical protein